MSRDRIKTLIVLKGIYDCLTDPYDQLNTGDQYGSVMCDIDRIIDLVVAECANMCEDHPSYGGRMIASMLIKKYGIQDDSAI